jgi:hypothetical protein
VSGRIISAVSFEKVTKLRDSLVEAWMSKLGFALVFVFAPLMLISVSFLVLNLACQFLSASVGVV